LRSGGSWKWASRRERNRGFKAWSLADRAGRRGGRSLLDESLRRRSARRGSVAARTVGLTGRSLQLGDGTREPRSLACSPR
jgi:hypothetical protein